MPYCRIIFLPCVFMMFGNLIAEYPCKCWQGTYFSGQFGYVWRDNSVKFTNANLFNPTGAREKFGFQSKRWGGGVAFGTNIQCGYFVIGGEVGGTFINDTRTHQSPFTTSSQEFSSTANFSINLKAKAGLAYKQLFAYASGGLAEGSLELKLNDFNVNILTTKTKWVAGWTAGGGIEYMFCGIFSLGVEYNYIQFKSRHLKIPCPNCESSTRFIKPRVNSSHQIHTVCLKLSLMFSIFRCLPFGF